MEAPGHNNGLYYPAINREDRPVPTNMAMGSHGPFRSGFCSEVGSLQAVPVHLPSPGGHSLISPGTKTV